ncbi:ArsR family transcriptional regulator [Undibacterium sp. GrIS 1.8]|uniref:ArsR/SmtB family transcription factor n=1 Tax=unclassified Undibacterium TaxID=2630295 RepID=UPI003393AC84
METKQAVSALAAIAQDSRLAIFRLLVQSGPSGVIASKISELLGIAPSSLSFHLKELMHAGLITVQQDGRFMIYAANFTVMNDLIGFLTENCCGGNPCSPNATCAPVDQQVTERENNHGSTANL